MKRERWPLPVLAALFVSPFVLAVLLFAGRGQFGNFELLANPDRELFASPVQIPAESLRLADGSLSAEGWARSRWTLIYAKMRPCAGQCDAALGRLSQVHLALGGERERVGLVFLAPAVGYASQNAAGYLVGDVLAPANGEFVRLLGPGRLEGGRIFVVDPLGNSVSSYPADADQGRLLEDLERLLAVSQIG